MPCCSVCKGLPRPHSKKKRKCLPCGKHVVYLNANEFHLIGKRVSSSNCPKCGKLKCKRKVRGQVHHLALVNTRQLDKIKKYSGRRKGILVATKSGRPVRAFNPTTRALVRRSYRRFLRSGIPNSRTGAQDFYKKYTKDRMKELAKQQYEAKEKRQHLVHPSRQQQHHHHMRQQHLHRRHTIPELDYVALYSKPNWNTYKT